MGAVEFKRCLVAGSRFAYGNRQQSVLKEGENGLDIVDQLAASGVLDTDLMLYTRRGRLSFQKQAHSLWVIQR